MTQYQQRQDARKFMAEFPTLEAYQAKVLECLEASKSNIKASAYHLRNMMLQYLQPAEAAQRIQTTQGR